MDELNSTDFKLMFTFFIQAIRCLCRYAFDATSVQSQTPACINQKDWRDPCINVCRMVSNMPGGERALPSIFHFHFALRWSNGQFDSSYECPQCSPCRMSGSDVAQSDVHMCVYLLSCHVKRRKYRHWHTHTPRMANAKIIIYCYRVRTQWRIVASCAQQHT